jgi:hypothetical protein
MSLGFIGSRSRRTGRRMKMPVIKRITESGGFSVFLFLCGYMGLLLVAIFGITAVFHFFGPDEPTPETTPVALESVQRIEARVSELEKRVENYDRPPEWVFELERKYNMTRER